VEPRKIIGKVRASHFFHSLQASLYNPFSNNSVSELTVAIGATDGLQTNFGKDFLVIEVELRI
jgi:hypothetical protein